MLRLTADPDEMPLVAVMLGYPVLGIWVLVCPIKRIVQRVAPVRKGPRNETRGGRDRSLPAVFENSACGSLFVLRVCSPTRYNQDGGSICRIDERGGAGAIQRHLRGSIDHRAVCHSAAWRARRGRSWAAFDEQGVGGNSNSISER